jgi:hypothetical protein
VSRRRPVWACLAGAGLTALGIGCADSARVDGGGGALAGDAAGGSVRIRPGGLMPGLDRGLRSWQWRVAEARLTAPLGDILASVAVTPPPGAGASPELEARLARNGLRLLAVPRASIDRLRALVAAPAMQVETWHGEAVDWRALALVRPPGDSAAVVIGERVRRYPEGSFRLAARAWTMRMEDGPHLQIELRVDHVATRRDRGLLAGRVRSITRPVDDLVVELAAPADLAWIIVAAPIDEVWPAPGTPLDGGPRADVAGRTTADEDEPAPTPPGAAARTIGPPVIPLPTVGQRLLAGQADEGLREMIILEPELPAVLFPTPPSSTARPASAPAPAATGAAR